jgi:hypothetical protein
MVEQSAGSKPIEVSSKEKPEAEARPGNIALDVKRPLFEQGPNWPF